MLIEQECSWLLFFSVMKKISNQSIVDLEDLIDNVNVNMTGVTQIESLLNRFEQVKHRISPQKRKQLRVHLVTLNETGLSLSKETVMKFADSAFQTPQGNIYIHNERHNKCVRKTFSIQDLSKIRALINSTDEQRMYEDAIRKNEHILMTLVRSQNRHREIENLRADTSKLINYLNQQIKCEQKIIKCPLRPSLNTSTKRQ